MKNFLRRHGRSISYLLITDWVLLVGTFGVALRLRHFDTSLNIISRSHIIPEALFVLFYAFLVIGLFTMLKLYRRKVWLTRAWHGFQILLGVAMAMGAYMLLRVVTKSPVFIVSRAVTLNWGILLLTALFIHRLFIFPALLRLASKNNLQRRVVIIGAQEKGIRFAEECLREENYSSLKPIGFLCDHREKGEAIFKDLCCIGHLEDLPEIVDLHKIEGAVITSTEISYTQLMNLIEQCIRFFGWVDVHNEKSAVLHENLDTDTYFDIPFVRMREIPRGMATRVYKETLDAIGATAGIILLSPILIVTAIAIKLTSPGPILYKSNRVGFKGELFNFYKFRSMAVGADQDKTREEAVAKFIQSGDADIPGSKIVDTAYVTPVGKFIRKWAIDELPQLFNVLKGDMSLVGPRPVPANEHEASDEWHKKRFDIKPGCTGLWKVFASKQGCAFNHTVLYDLYYARNMSLQMDIYVILGTIKVILTGKADT